MRSRTIALIFLSFLIIILIGLIVLLGIRIRSSQLPSDDSVAATQVPGGTCTPGGDIECLSGFCCSACNKCASNGNGADCDTICNSSPNACLTSTCNPSGFQTYCSNGSLCNCVAVSGGTAGCADRYVISCQANATCSGGSTGGGGGGTGGGGSVANGTCGIVYSSGGNFVTARVPSLAEDPDCTGSYVIETYSGPADAFCASNREDRTLTAGQSTSREAPCGNYCAQVDGPGGGQRVNNTSACPTSSTPTTVRTSTPITSVPGDLPETALISDSADRILIGVTLLILGVITYRLSIVDKGFNMLSMNMQNLSHSLSTALDFKTKRRNHDRQKFEGQFTDETE